MESVVTYLDYCVEKGTLYETDKENVLNMYTNLITYNYAEIFTSHQTILSKKIYDIHYETENNTLVDNLVDNTVYKMASLSASTITTSEISGTVYKTYVVHNNNSFKEYIIIKKAVTYDRLFYFCSMMFSKIKKPLVLCVLFFSYFM